MADNKKSDYQIAREAGNNAMSGVSLTDTLKRDFYRNKQMMEQKAEILRYQSYTQSEEQDLNKIDTTNAVLILIDKLEKEQYPELAQELRKKATLIANGMDTDTMKSKKFMDNVKHSFSLIAASFPALFGQTKTLDRLTLRENADIVLEAMRVAHQSKNKPNSESGNMVSLEQYSEKLNKDRAMWENFIDSASTDIKSHQYTNGVIYPYSGRMLLNTHKYYDDKVATIHRVTDFIKRLERIGSPLQAEFKKKATLLANGVDVKPMFSNGILGKIKTSAIYLTSAVGYMFGVDPSYLLNSVVHRKQADERLEAMKKIYSGDLLPVGSAPTTNISLFEYEKQLEDNRKEYRKGFSTVADKIQNSDALENWLNKEALSIAGKSFAHMDLEKKAKAMQGLNSTQILKARRNMLNSVRQELETAPQDDTASTTNTSQIIRINKNSREL